MVSAWPCGPYFWLTRAMMPAKAGEEAEVPPTPVICTRLLPEGDWQSPSVAQVGMKLKLPPLAAKSETSGRSRTPSVGTPVPVCHEGLGYPPPQVTVAPVES